MTSLPRRSILVTGGGRGIGRATAVLAGAKGWSVAINYLGNASAAVRTVNEVISSGGQATAIQGDVTVEADVLAVFNQAEGKLGRLDGVVINAGIVAPSMMLADMSAERLKRMFDVNVLGAYRLPCRVENARCDAGP